MATTQNLYTGDGSTVLFSFTFPYLETSHVKVSLDGVDTTAYSLANATTVEFDAAPANGVAIRIYRLTDIETVNAVFYKGSSIRADDLNDNFAQTLYQTQENANTTVTTDGANPFVGDVDMGGFRITNLGNVVDTDDAASKGYVDTLAAAGYLAQLQSFVRWTKTAAGGETSLSGNADDATPLAYEPGLEQVYINGALLTRGSDYVATSGTSITGLAALIAGDIVEVLSVSGYIYGTVPNSSVYNEKVAEGAGIVSTKLSFTQAGTGAVARTVDSKLKDVVSVKDFGAVGDGVADDTAAIQAAIDSTPNGPSSYCPGKTSGGGGRLTVLFPEGTYKVTAPLDMSQRDYTRLVALGRSTISSTSTTYVLDMSSCDHCVVEGLAITSNTARVGIYINRSTINPFAMFNVIRDVAVTLGTDVTANSGNGRIGIYNGRGEQNIFENLVLRCDVPYWAQNTADALFPPTSGTLDTSIASGTLNTHIQCNFISNGSHNTAVVLKGVSSFDFVNCYWGRAALNSGTLNYAVYGQGINHCSFSGSVEVLARFMYVVGSSYGLTTNIIMQVDTLDNGGVFNLDYAGGNGVIDSDIKVLVAGGTPAAGACIFKDSGTATSVTIVGNIISTTSLMIPITVVGGRTVDKNIVRRDNQISISGPSITNGSITAAAIENSPIGATTPSTGQFTTLTATTSDFVGSIYASVATTTSSITDGITTYKGTPDGAGWEHAKIYGGRDTADGFTYGSYLAFYTEGKNSGTTDTSVERGRWTAAGHFHPAGDNTQTLGKAANRWSVVYAGTGTINTSDGREKQDIAALDAAEMRVATAVKSLIRKYRFRDAVADKGADARIHIGVIVQDVIAAFEAEGLDPMRYGIVCHDQWEAELDADGNEVRPAGDRFGIRYEELLAFIIAAL